MTLSRYCGSVPSWCAAALILVIVASGSLALPGRAAATDLGDLTLSQLRDGVRTALREKIARIEARLDGWNDRRVDPDTPPNKVEVLRLKIALALSRRGSAQATVDRISDIPRDGLERRYERLVDVVSES